MISKILLAETLNAVIGDSYPCILTTSPLARTLGLYVGRGELNLNLDGKELYNNAKECLELACFEVENYED